MTKDEYRTRLRESRTPPWWRDTDPKPGFWTEYLWAWGSIWQTIALTWRYLWGRE